MREDRLEHQPLLQEDSSDDENILAVNNGSPDFHDPRQIGLAAEAVPPDDGILCHGSVEGQGSNVIYPQKVYRRRWYILFLYCLFTTTSGAVWNTWGPISQTSEAVFGWTDSTIALLTDLGPASFILSGLLYPWLMQTKGLRWTCVSCMFIIGIGTTCRVITSDPHNATILIYVGQFVCGLPGPIAMGAIPFLSSTWFPPKERVVSTSVGSCFSLLGAALSFIIGPALVSPRGSHVPHHNSTSHPKLSWLHSHTNGSVHFGDDLATHFPLDATTAHNSSGDEIAQEKRDIMLYMYYACGWSWLLFIVMVIYMPARPPMPPCLSASIERKSYWSGLMALKSNGPFILVAIVYGLPSGVIGVWSSMLSVNLHPIGVDEKEAGWIGFYAMAGPCVCSLVISRLAVYFTRHMKLMVVVLYFLGTASFIVFALMLVKVVPFTHTLLYMTIITGTTLIVGSIPLLFEIACEVAYPVSESASNGIMTYVNSLSGMVFLSILALPKVGTMWMNWTLIGSCIASIPLLIFLRDRFSRLEVDEGIEPDTILQQEVEVEAATPPLSVHM